MERQEPERRHSPWSEAPEVRAPEPDEVHVFSLSLDPAAERLEDLASLLSADETDRASRFRFPRDRRRFVTGRASLRLILGACLGERPERVAFTYGERGKPALGARFKGAALSFNVSHSEDLGLVAVARGREVGVDVERRRPLRDAAAIAERFFSTREREELLALPEAEREAAFFAGWARKEAFIKATGEGLARPLDGFTVSLRAGEPARLTAVVDDPDEAARWSLVSLDPAPEFSAALVTRGGFRELRCNEWRAAAPLGTARPARARHESFLEAQ